MGGKGDESRRGPFDSRGVVARALEPRSYRIHRQFWANVCPLFFHGGQKPCEIAASRIGTVAAGNRPMLQKLHREVMHMRFVRSFLSRKLGQLTRPSAPRGAAWRNLSEFQACLVTHGHELLVEHRASSVEHRASSVEHRASSMEEPGVAAGGTSGTAGSAHEDASSVLPMPMTRSALMTR